MTIYIAYAAILTMAVLPIYVGSYLSLTSTPTESMQTKDAFMFPLIGSTVLLSLYILFKFFKDYVNLVMSFYFLVLGVSALSTTLSRAIGHSLPKSLSEKKILKFSIPAIRVPFIGKEESSDHSFSLVDIISIIISIVFGLWYFMTKNWIANDLFGEAFSLLGVELFGLGSFKVGAILLSGLFFYDIFWVFGTDVMVTVAKSFNAPIKLMFPKNIFNLTAPEFSMLGLGDIVIPGVFIALMLRFDRHLAAKRKQPTSNVYFMTCMTSYILGLATTIFVMHAFQAAQPALLYLVPYCLGSVVIHALIRGEFKELWDYTEENEEKKKKDE
eukprot:gb/GECH01012111.1/.p1 GENE.gb/GECH01012111.1/~~gb/GECH01012111.1/.p1  ORF type:complete len:328 (+),score=58.92 gb/GECH01012111.1/:1-984(+)